MTFNNKSKIHYGWIILGVSVITVFASLGLGRFGYTMILPAMKSGLMLTDSQAGDLATANMTGYLALALTCGILSSRFSPRAIIFFFMILLSAAMLLTGLADSFSAAFAGRLLAGMGSGGTNIPVLAIVIAWFSPARRGLAAGITVSGSSFALLVTGLMIPPVLNHFGSEGWRWSWFILSGAALLAAVICVLVLRNSPGEKGLLPVGSEGRELENKSAPSIFNSIKMVYRSSAVWHLAGIYTLYGFSYIIYATFFVRYLNWEGGLSLEDAGKLWSLVGAVSIASGFIWGSVSDRIGRKHGLFFVYFIQFASYTVFGLWKGPGGFYLSALLFALTAWSIPAIMAAAAGDILGPRAGSAALGFITLFFGIGQTAGPFIAGRIADMTGSYTGAFIIAGSASLAGALLCLGLRPIRGKN